ncbi:MAG TPA: transcriptional regulator [Gammaproteobacteria bacterium]|nr:transcriptional regulator [Gammaproteobacteria bacterium]
MAKSAAKPKAAVTEATQRLRAVAGAVGGQESAEFGRLLYDRIRLGIMSALSVNRTMSFAELKELLETTDGNLSKHARRLEDAGLVSCRKAFADRVPRTQYSLTAKGKRAFARHLEHMEALIAATREE